jgi:hypothetical protein
VRRCTLVYCSGGGRRTAQHEDARMAISYLGGVARVNNGTCGPRVRILPLGSLQGEDLLDLTARDTSRVGSRDSTSVGSDRARWCSAMWLGYGLKPVGCGEGGVRAPGGFPVSLRAKAPALPSWICRQSASV